MKKTLVIWLTAIAMLFVFGCSPAAPASSTSLSDGGQTSQSSAFTVTDMQGRTLDFKGPIRRVVVNQWDIAEVVMTVVGEEFADMFVGVGTSGSADTFQRIYGEKYPQLKDMPKIGGGGSNAFDVEAIIALKPDLFLLNTRSSSMENTLKTAEDLAKAGIPTVVTTMSENPEKSPVECIKLIGQLFGKEQRAKEIADFIEAQFAILKSQNLSGKKDKPTVYQEKGSGTAEEYDVTSTTDGWASIIALAGGDNIAIGSIGASGKIDPEYLIRSDPDYIITGALGYCTKEEGVQKADGTIGQYSKRTGWDQLTAVRENRIHMLFHDHSRNQFAFYPALYMAKLFYPDVFTTLDPDAVLKEFFDRFMLLDYEDGVWSAHSSLT